jgi:DNA-binding GntR family transcriptional regulator
MTPILTATMEVYISARRQSLTQNRNLQGFVEEHRQIIAAIEQQQITLTAQLLAAHIDAARTRVQEIMTGTL